MGCGCGSNKSGNCSSNLSKLRNYKKQLQTLITTSKDEDLKIEYQKTLEELDSLITSNSCPDKIILNYFKVYVSNEYAKFKQ